MIPAIYLVELCFECRAFASPIATTMVRWRQELHETCMDLRTRALSPAEWQASMESLYARVELSELLRFIDFERLVQGIQYPDDRAAVRSVEFPRVEGVPDRVRYGRKVFAMRRGTAIVPHGHNNMVSAHLVARGRFHVRTFDRVRDEPGHLVITPSIDETYDAGRVLTMSDMRDNVHWLVAQSDHAFTFDVPVTDLFPGRRYPTPAQHHGMIHIDPRGASTDDGLIRAPVMDPERSIECFGSGDPCVFGVTNSRRPS